MADLTELRTGEQFQKVPFAVRLQTSVEHRQLGRR